ncbi:MAG: S26 family signal peptidase [Anaerolineae bacterium]
MSGGLLFTSEHLSDDAGLLLTTSTTALRRLASERPGETLHCALAGPSMFPTLHASDLLVIVPYGSTSIAVGDVVVCLPAERDQPIVHRVTKVTSQRIRTRGDSNDRDDPWLLQPADVVGRVVAAWRGERRHLIHGGWRGRAQAYLVWLGTKVERSVSRLLHSPYHTLARSGIVQAIVPTRLKPRIVAFRGTDTYHLRLVVGRRTVGWYDSAAQSWHIRRPYRLFVDQQVLSGAEQTALTLRRD